jgi:flavin-dependent dehydrogenase
MLFELANSLRSLTSPLTSALHAARRMARPLHFEEGGTVPTHGAAGGQQDHNAFPLPPDIREEEVASAIRDWLQAKRFSAPKRNIDAVSPLKTSVDGKVFVPADVVLLLGDGAADRGKQVMEKIVNEIRHRRVLNRLAAMAAARPGR